MPALRKTSFRNILLLGLASLALTPTRAQSKRVLLALSKADHTLALVDPSSLKIIGRLPVGSDPHEVIASSDGTKAYVTIYGGGSFHEINVLDLTGMKALDNIDTRPLYGPHGIDFVAGKVWFSAEGSKAVGRYDPATGKLDWAMGTGEDRTHMIFVTPDAKTIYTTNINSATVSILSDTIFQPGPTAPPGARPREEWRQTLVPTARGSEGFDVSPKGTELWTAASEDGSITVIDLGKKALAARLDANVKGANRLKFTPDGKQVFVASLGTGDLTVFDAATRKEVKRIKLGRGCAGILMDPVAGRAFVACSADNNIAIIDLKTLQVTGHLDVGGTPDGLAWAGQ